MPEWKLVMLLSRSGLADLGIDVEDVHNEGAEIDGIETGVVDVVNRRRELIACDGEDHLVGVPRLANSGVGGA
jgi:hypothetical protein